MFKFIEKYDIKAAKYINSLYHSKTLDNFMKFFTYLGNLGLLWIGISIVFMLSHQSRKKGVVLISALLLTTILGECIIKHIVKRKRPFIKMNLCDQLIIGTPSTYSFPSGHTASSFAASAVFLAINSRISILILLISTCIGLSRIYLKVHYLSDVIGGAILGLLCGSITVSLFNIV
ncbi:phosphatase PAP2 family protein [Clostridium sp. LQ25]|uniref:phosphatase PAP2 family protein n=1 Tax=Clostridium TaxID=1485 RepID=UPI00210408E0|nr:MULTISPECIES: phosphatase PAP2 family protein [Clostridium]MCQ2014752.1 phosphatase PAP2 family protein [Clostridium butyricum]MCQ2027174.1 phosphatase PAP2 family protein [Clostridium butyricum]MDU1604159.1 phosphatase PAP2 family protein [Clostridium sp.]UZT08543.1 phosphatase PAP2 family protein [Clostridium sp. LQ25]